MILNGWLATRIWPSLCNRSQSAPTGVSRRRLEMAFRHGRGEWSARSSNWYTEICCSGYYIIYRGFQKTTVFPQKTLSTQRFPKIWLKKHFKTIGFPIDNHRWMISAPWGSTETSREDCRHQSAGWKHGALSSWRRGDLSDTKPKKHGDFDSWCEVLFEVGDFNDKLRDFNH